MSYFAFGRWERLFFCRTSTKTNELLTCPKKLIQFTVEEGGEDHSHVAALSLANQRIFDWLNKTLDIIWLIL
jgi:hypothetical protein